MTTKPPGPSPDDRARTRAATLRLLARRPRTLATHVLHRAVRRRELRRLRGSYATRIASPGEVGDLRPPQIDVPPVSELPEALRQAAECLRQEAEMTMAGEVPLLGWGLACLRNKIDWHTDFYSGVSWPLDFYLDLRVLRSDEGADPKVPWELSRCHHLLTLGRAARLFEEPAYVHELHAQLESWLDANPPGHGINWSNPMEVALRAVNWFWALGTSEPVLPPGAALRRRLAGALLVHGRHIAANLEGGPALRGNHYLADLLGLAVIGAWLDTPEARSWHRWACSALEREVRTQLEPDGASFEASLPYHGLVLEILALGLVAASAGGHSLSAEYRRKLAAMAELSRAVRHPGGRSPVFGDQDSGRVLPAGFARSPTHDHVVWLAAALLDQDRPFAAAPHEEVAWTLGVAAWRRLAIRPVRPAPTRRAFPDAGVYVMGQGEAHLVVRCGGVGQNGFGGHAHNDISCFELSLGELLVVDPGSYTYTADLEQRDAFRAARAHNVLTVDGREMHPFFPAEPFRLRAHGRCRIEAWEPREDRWRLTCAHDGFRRRGDQVLSRRTFELRASPPQLEVIDEVNGTAGPERLLESRIHLAHGVVADLSGRGEVRLRAGEREFVVRVAGAENVSVQPAWISTRYGERVRGHVIVAQSRARLPKLIRYRIGPQTQSEGAADCKVGIRAEVGIRP
jgi:uncharacterized heparinase superfamily protein